MSQPILRLRGSLTLARSVTLFAVGVLTASFAIRGGASDGSVEHSLAAGPISHRAEVTHLLDPSLPVLRVTSLPPAFENGRSAFTITIDGMPIGYRVFGVVALPGRVMEIRAPGAGSYRLVHSAGSVTVTGDGGWRWTPPGAPGVEALSIEHAESGASVHLNVMVAYSHDDIEDEELLGYRIGRYQEQPLNGDVRYLPPEAFVEVGAEDEDILVAPHFTLGQFLCKQVGDPRVLAFSEPLLLKLEAILEATNAAGYSTPSFVVMSGFRTPAYNRAIGNTTDYSRHLWGDAADIYIDRDGDGEMDDLNGDGRSDLADVGILSAIVEELMRDAPDDIEPGGLALYSRNAAHGPFVHVDARGTRARW